MNSTNIKVISEEIQRLKDQVHAIDVEVPDPSDATDGQILSTDNGKYVISDPELPATTAASTGDVLGLVGEAKTPGWITPYNPLDYSENEQDTGIKWINGINIYRKVISDTLPDSTGTYIKSTGVTGDIFRYDVFLTGTTTNVQLNSITYVRKTDNSLIISVQAGQVSTSYYAIVYYTKEPAPEPTVTKKKTTKKGE